MLYCGRKHAANGDLSSDGDLSARSPLSVSSCGLCFSSSLSSSGLSSANQLIDEPVSSQPVQ